MISDWNRGICGLLTEDVIPVNDTAAFINDAVLAAVNVPFCVFAVPSNLVAVVAVVKTPALHKPCNILLCSLAFADCLTGVISQPLSFIVRRSMIHRAHISCDYQLELYVLHRCSLRLTTSLSFVNITVMSFDRFNALSKPLQYHANASNRDAIIKAVLAGVSVTLFIVTSEVFLSSNLSVMFLAGSVVHVFASLTPFINHVRMFIAVRAHRNEVLDVAGSSQRQAIILRRERNVAYHMMILIAALLICLVPVGLFKTFQSSFVELYRYLCPWTLSFSLINASVNPIINFWWSKGTKGDNITGVLLNCKHHDLPFQVKKQT